MQVVNKKPDHIKIPAHIVRKDMGDLEALADDIHDLGLLQRIGIDKNDNLVFGSRRLAAIKMLAAEGHKAGEWVGCEVFETAHELATALLMQQAENGPGRKDFTPSEKVALGILIEESLKIATVEVPVPKGGIRPDNQTVNIPVETINPVSPFSNAAKEAADAVGMSPVTYDKAKKVVDAAAKEPEKFGDLKAEMDKTGEVAPAHRELQKRRTKADSMKDKEGVEIPIGLRDIFGDPWLAEVLDGLERIKADLERNRLEIERKSPAYYEWMSGGINSDRGAVAIRVAIKSVGEVVDFIEENKPYCVCTVCKSDLKIVRSCLHCRKSGWMPLYRFEELNADALPS